jgi:hypothetical protein
MEIKVEWTGKYPNLCSGRWIITANDKHLTIPSAFVNSNMGTFKDYNTWSFGDDWLEVWDSYPDGDEFEIWIFNNRSWIYEAFKSAGLVDELTFEDLRTLYNEINKQDWRHNSCGGCI